MATAGKPTEILTVVSSGTKGITELAAYIDPSTVSYVLCRIPIGAGSFKREKLVVLHLQVAAVKHVVYDVHDKLPSNTTMVLFSASLRRWRLVRRLSEVVSTPKVLK